MKKSLIVIAALVTLAIPALCAAAPARPGAYVSGFLGATVPTESNVTSSDFTSGTSFDDRVEFDPGIAVGGTIGYDYGMIRLEGELSYRQADIKGVTDQANGFRFGNPDGSLGALAMMFNAFFDLHTGTAVTPYWGGGIGFAVLRLSDTFATDIVGGAPQRVLLYAADDDTVLAYQAGVGLEIALDRQFSLDLGYRFFGTSKARFDADPVSTTTLKLESHNALMGLRMKF
jgi:opacity protein-like surface antigen